MAEDQEIKPWVATPDFFDSNPRSKEIREKCKIIVPIINQLRTKVEPNSDLAANLHAQLETLNGGLVELGITPNMQMEKPLKEYQLNPVIATEYLAGQLVALMGQHIISEQEIRPILQEHDELEGEHPQVVMAELGRLPEKVIQFNIQAGVLGIVSNLLCIETNPEDSQKTP